MVKKANRKAIREKKHSRIRNRISGTAQSVLLSALVLPYTEATSTSTHRLSTMMHRPLWWLPAQSRRKSRMLSSIQTTSQPLRRLAKLLHREQLKRVSKKWSSTAAVTSTWARLLHLQTLPARLAWNSKEENV